MKISKSNQNIKQCDKAEIKSEEVIEVVETVPESDTVCMYGAACDLILAAIEELAKFAETDEKAKDSIANLSVVLFDLK